MRDFSKTSWLRISCIGLAMFALLSLFSWTARADVTLSVAFGFNGHFLPERLTPVRITLANNGPPISGQLELRQTVKTPLQAGEFTQKTIYRLELESDTKKTFEFYIHIHGYIYPLEIRLQSGKETLAEKSVDVRETFATEKLLLGVSDPPLPRQLPDGQALEPVRYETLPTQWIGYDAVSRIYLGSLDTNLLSKPQREALRDWLIWGGELVILGGPNWQVQRSDWLEELLPLTSTHLELRKVGDRETSFIAGKLKGEKPRYKMLQQLDDGTMVVSQRTYGLGKVVFYGVDPLRVPGVALPEKPQAPKNAKSDNSLTISSGRNLLTEVQIEHPSREVITLALAMTILCFSLLSLAMMRASSGRVYLASIIVVLLGASGGLWGYVNQPIYSNTLEGLELSVERSFADEGRSTVQTWYSLHTQRTTSLELEVPGSFLRQVPPEGAYQHPSDLTMEQTDENLKISLNLLSQKQEHFVLEQVKPTDLRLTVARSVRPLQVSVYNGEHASLGPSLVVVDGQGYQIDAIAAGEVKQFTLTPGRELLSQWNSWDDGTGGPPGKIKRALLTRVRPLETGEFWLAWGESAQFSRRPDENRIALKLFVIGESEGTHVAK
ncbi:hypothetical protein HY009_09450 [Candidatus Acetothermia bacterium]|nr:hypothetical protein [Candidatus Acetothermia bacterium]